MRTRFSLVGLLVVLGAFVVAADAPPPPPPLVKPIIPGGNTSRIRLPMNSKTASSYFKAKITKPKAKKGDAAEYADITLSIGVQTFNPQCSIQQWKAWGFEVPANRMAVLPDLIIPGYQVSPKPAKGRDIEYHLKDIKVSLYEAVGGEKAGISNSFAISVDILSNNAEKQAEPRVFYADRFIELTAPNAQIKRLNTGEMTSPDYQITTDEKLLAAFIPTNRTAFSFITVNSHTQYMRATGKIYPVVGVMDIGAGTPITMAVNTARWCGVDLTPDESTGKIKELRLGPLTGPGVKGQKDLVLKDVPVVISRNEDLSGVWFSATFVETYFKDGVWACGPDGVWRLHIRMHPELAEDVKTRKPQPPFKKQ